MPKIASIGTSGAPSLAVIVDPSAPGLPPGDSVADNGGSLCLAWTGESDAGHVWWSAFPWTEPNRVDSANADFGPAVGTDGGGLYLAWKHKWKASISRTFDIFFGSPSDS
jgi:hypothetical protein